MKNNSIVYIAIAVVVVIAAYALSRGGFYGAGTTSVPVLLTDPPNVPAGTQQLLVNYSSVEVHTESTASANQSGWVTASGSGTVNLLAVVSESKTIAVARVAANSTINLVRLNITSVKIVINNTTYNVTTPNQQLTVAVVGGQKINSTSGVLIDISPTVHANATGYIMIPAARAIVVSSNTSVSINANVGGISNITARGRVGLGVNASIG